MNINDDLSALKKFLCFCSGITANHQNVRSNYMYVAIRGATHNGEDYISLAVANGAKYIVLSTEAVSTIKQENVAYIYINNTRFALSYLLSAFYKKQPQHLVAVTGTNGKTSVAHFYGQICSQLGFKSASIGTLGVLTFSQNYNDCKILNPLYQPKNQTPQLTTLDHETLHATLKKLADDGYAYVAVEASSHGLYQYRLDHVKFSAAAFTNLTRDHLDYHSTMDNYLDSKLRLFSEILPRHTSAHAVINADISEYNKLQSICQRYQLKMLDYGKEAKTLRLLNYSMGESIKIEVLGITYAIHCKLVGEFQIYNLLCSIGLCISVGLNMKHIAKIIPLLHEVPGRMEIVRTEPNTGLQIYVDYAHTPDGLKLALKELRNLVKNDGKLWVIFGCGGDRDRGKRQIMGGIANELADVIVITDDNPRNEDSAKIRAQIIETAPNAIEIADRGSAIQYGIKNLQPNDVLLVAGKGHEQYQIIGNKKLYFCDKECIKSATLPNCQ
ncbi:UDP-N-acetylmuramoyl-L-alanyl-D-glutamate--2, 6-diaminopimelate ligase [Alphaproteobacteria bacterium]